MSLIFIRILKQLCIDIDLRIKSYVKRKLAKLAPAKYTPGAVYDVAKPINKPENFKKLKQIAIKEHSKKVIEEAGKI